MDALGKMPRASFISPTIDHDLMLYRDEHLAMMHVNPTHLFIKITTYTKYQQDHMA